MGDTRLELVALVEFFGESNPQDLDELVDSSRSAGAREDNDVILVASY